MKCHFLDARSTRPSSDKGFLNYPISNIDFAASFKTFSLVSANPDIMHLDITQTVRLEKSLANILS